MRKGFLDIDRVTLPLDCVTSVYDHLRRMGRQGLEGVALWVGVRDGSSFEIRATVIPRQTASKTEDGLLYAVDGDELHRLNVWLFERQMVLLAQIHSHPGRAYHSETDDRYPIVATLGGMSVVVPDFGSRAPTLDSWAVYRLSEGRVWERLTAAEVRSLFTIT